MQTIEPTGLHAQLDWKTQWHRLTAVRAKDLAHFGKEVLACWSDHNVPRLGASVAFYTLMSLAPLLIVVVAVAGAVFGREAATGQLVWQIQDLIGRAGAETVQNLLRSTQKPGAGIIASVIGGVALAIGATSAVSELRAALNVIWCVPNRDQTGLRSIVSMLRDKGLAFVGVLGIGFLLLVSLAVNAALAAVSGQYHVWLPEGAAFFLQWLDLLVTLFVIAVLFTLIYKWMPDLRLEWQDVIPGGVFTAVLFTVGRVLIGYYLGRASYASVYGAAGSLVVFLIWVYYSAQIFFLGAEVTRAWAQTFGSKPCDRIGKEVRLPSELRRPEQPQNGEQLVHLP